MRAFFGVVWVIAWAAAVRSQLSSARSIPATPDELSFVLGTAAVFEPQVTFLPITTNASPTWRGITLSPETNKVYLSPWNSDAVLIVDPTTGETDATTLNGLGSAQGKYLGIAYAPNTGKL